MVENKCAVCGCAFKHYKSKPRKYCSHECYHEALKGSERPERMVERVTANCEGCGSAFEYRVTRPKKYCTFKCYRNKYKSPDKGKTKSCQKCGNVFVVKQTGQKLCSKACSIQVIKEYPRESAKTKMVVCENCCKMFETPYNSNQKHCTIKCYHENMVGSERPNRKTGDNVSCTNCGKDFYAPKHRIESRNNLYCSGECRDAYIADVLGGSPANNHVSGMSFRVRYNDQFFRSGWEALFARFLDELSLTWEYETHRIKYHDGKKMRTYIPDFYVKETNTYYEIKGFFSDKMKWKMDLVTMQNSDLDIEILSLRQLRELEAMPAEYLYSARKFFEDNKEFQIV